jgi:hypothetical protein
MAIANLAESLAAVLAGAWRREPPHLTLTPTQLDQFAPVLIGTNTGCLGWWRVRQSELRATRAARSLREAYRQNSAIAGAYESGVQELVPRLRAAGVEPILIKGWAVARLYPEPGLRPYCDADLCVRPAQLPAALAILGSGATSYHWVDLHEGVPDVTDRGWDELLRRSRLVQLGTLEVRILSPEDQLRQLCLHWRRHLDCLPLGLCDVAVLLETQSGDFDWDYCLSGDPVLVDWVLCVVGLACRLLGADLNGHAVGARVRELPAWLVRRVLWQWQAGWTKPTFGGCLRRPTELVGAVMNHWLDPLKAAYRMRLSPQRSLAWIQLTALLGRPYEVVLRLARQLGKPWRRPEPVVPFSVHPQREYSRFL